MDWFVWGLVPAWFSLADLETTASLDDMADAHRVIEARHAVEEHYRRSRGAKGS